MSPAPAGTVPVEPSKSSPVLLLVILSLVILLASTSCATIEKSDDILPPVYPDSRYDALFPYFRVES